MAGHRAAARRQDARTSRSAASSTAPRLMTPRSPSPIPVYNGARYLDEVLARGARAARRPRGRAARRRLGLDRRLARDRRAPRRARSTAIPKAEFSHGGTRNRMMELAEGDHVAFLTQDATPAHDGWLAALLEGFEQADDVALVFGPHEPRPDASHMIKCEMERHFATWGDGGARSTCSGSGARPRRSPTYRALPRPLDVLLRRQRLRGASWAWRASPLPRRSPTPRTSCSGAR